MPLKSAVSNIFTVIFRPITLKRIGVYYAYMLHNLLSSSNHVRRSVQFLRQLFSQIETLKLCCLVSVSGHWPGDNLIRWGCQCSSFFTITIYNIYRVNKNKLGLAAFWPILVFFFRNVMAANIIEHFENF